MPTLVIGHHDDPFHPYEIAQAHTDTIPGATLRTVPSKDADAARFAADRSLSPATSLAQDSIPLPRLVEAELRGDAGLHGAAIALLNHYERAPA